MKIKVWGSRGSLPTPGPETTHYGGNTCCIEVRLDDGGVVIFDAGSGIRKLGRRLAADSGISEITLVLTHPHWDHLMGFPFFLPAYLPRFKIHVRGGPRAKRFLKGYLEQQMEAPFFPVRFDAMKAAFEFSQGVPQVRRIGSAELEPISVSHPNGCYGFRLTDAGRRFVFFTDHELGLAHDTAMPRQAYVDFCRGADLLFHDAQYTDEQYVHTRGWGHTTFFQATDFAVEARVSRIGLFHHDPDHSDAQISQFESACRDRIRRAGADVECFAVREGMEIEL